MSIELNPNGGQNPLSRADREEQAKKHRAAYTAQNSSGIYGGIGWMVGLLITLILAGVLAFVVANVDVSRSARSQIIAVGIAIIWWFNPLSLGGLGYIASNARVWRFWTILAVLVWIGVNTLVSFSIVSDTARAQVVNGFVILGYVLLGLLFLYIQFRVFFWASTGKPGRFFFGLLGWAALNGIIYWAIISPDVLGVVLFVLRYAFQIAFAIGFAVIQFVAIFWFMSQTRVEVILPGDPKQITFDDYKGQPNLLKMVRQWISLLSDRTQFQRMGGQFINGLLLYGEPGTGKTLLAKAMAGEAGIAFISIEGSGFRGMFWGVDTLRMIQFVRRARKLAREYGSCIAYIDEIDAVGMSRGGVMGGAGGMMGMGGMGAGSGALTRLLYEMDGIGEQTRWEKLRARWYQWRKKKLPPRDWHILFMGSTNRPDVLDPALTRPGRFDRTIVVNKPDRTGRREIVKYYLGKIKIDETVDIEAIISDTAWATPARIMSAITKDAVRLALFDGRERVSQRDIEYAFQEQAMGLENPVEEMEEDQRRQIAYHEAGHAVVQFYLRPDERIVRVSIVRRSDALGYVLPVSNYDIYSLPLRTFLADIMVSMAGHVATKLFLDEYWTGATSDFRSVRARLWQLGHYGYFGPPLDMNGEGLRMDREKIAFLEGFWVKLQEQTEKILFDHSGEVHAIAKALLEKGDMSGRECIEIIRSVSEGAEPVDSERLLKGLVDETIVIGAIGNNGANGDDESDDEAPKKKKKSKAKTSK